MDLENRIASLAEAGRRLRSFPGSGPVAEAADQARAENPWFTPEHIAAAVDAWARLLEPASLEAWLEPWRERLLRKRDPVTVGVVMAGNIPMVGFHDLLCVLISGNRLKSKLSSQDRRLLPAFVKSLEQVEPAWRERVTFEEGRLTGFDAIIATGSNNTSRYFEYYFGKYPHIIRKNRTGVAILKGSETDRELDGLAEDVFQYFGLGCRNVSALFVPEGYDLSALARPFSRFAHFFNHHKYRNNYDYNRSVLMLNGEHYTDGGFYLLKEDPSLASPVSVIHYHYYTDPGSLRDRIGQLRDQIQCIVSAGEGYPGTIPPGTAQSPGLADYADGIDTMAFLLEKI